MLATHTEVCVWGGPVSQCIRSYWLCLEYFILRTVKSVFTEINHLAILRFERVINGLFSAIIVKIEKGGKNTPHYHLNLSILQNSAEAKLLFIILKQQDWVNTLHLVYFLLSFSLSHF